MACTLAVLGDDVPFAYVAAALGSSPHDAMRELQPLSAAGIVSTATDRVRFSHDTIREAIAASMGSVERQLRHRQIAERLTAVAEGPYGVMVCARHLLAAGPAADPARVATWAAAAGQICLESTLWTDATT